MALLKLPPGQNTDPYYLFGLKYVSVAPAALTSRPRPGQLLLPYAQIHRMPNLAKSRLFDGFHIQPLPVPKTPFIFGGFEGETAMRGLFFDESQVR